MTIFFIIGMLTGYLLSVVGNKISGIIEDFYFFSNVSYIKEILLEFTLFKYFLKINKSDFNTSSLKTHIFHSLIIGFTFAVEYYYYSFFHFEFYKLILILFAFSILYIGIITDIRTQLIPDAFILIPSIVLIYINFPDYIDNIKYFFIIYFSSYLAYFIYIKTNKILIGVQDIKIYALSILLFGIAPINEILFLSSTLALIFFIYRYIKYKTQTGHFGFFIYIALVIYPLFEIFGFDYFKNII